MKNRLYLVCGVLLVAAVFGFCVWAPWEPREPVYDGKPLSYWLSYPSTPAVRTIASDSNAIPLLIRALDRKDTLLGRGYLRVWPKLPPPIRSHVPRPINNFDRRACAMDVLGRMGPSANPSIPALIRTLREDDSAPIRVFAARCLFWVGQGDRAAVAGLSEAASNDTDQDVRKVASDSLWRLDPEAAARAGVKKPSSP
jgi:hypothetical protein